MTAGIAWHDIATFLWGLIMTIVLSVVGRSHLVRDRLDRDVATKIADLSAQLTKHRLDVAKNYPTTPVVEAMLAQALHPIAATLTSISASVEAIRSRELEALKRPVSR